MGLIFGADRHGLRARRVPNRFTPAWWCRGPHMQTLWPNLVRRRPGVRLRRERLELPDRDFIDIDWLDNLPPAGEGSRRPIVVVLHGLQGSSRSVYVRGLLRALEPFDWHIAVMHFRGCSGEPNRLARSYHSGETGDFRYVLGLLRRRAPRVPLAAVGYSLGGNVLLKYLGESEAESVLRAAVAVSVPMVLHHAASRLERGFPRVYQWQLLRCMRRAVEAKRSRTDFPLKARDLARLRTFREFDEHVTAPLHGFLDADHYYAMSSARPYLGRIRVPTLLLHARDDPFMTEGVIPDGDELSEAIEFELYDHGGHVGFVAGRWPWRARYWLEERIPAYLRSVLAADEP